MRVCNLIPPRRCSSINSRINFNFFCFPGVLRLMQSAAMYATRYFFIIASLGTLPNHHAAPAPPFQRVLLSVPDFQEQLTKDLSNFVLRRLSSTNHDIRYAMRVITITHYNSENITTKAH